MGKAWDTYQRLDSGDIARLPHGFWSRPMGVINLVEIVRHLCEDEGIHPANVRRVDIKRWRLDAGLVQLFNGSMVEFNKFSTAGYSEPDPIVMVKKARKALTNAVMSKVWTRDEGKCVECGSTDDLEFDHMIPHSKGGTSTVENLRILCQTCNRSRGNRI